MSSDARASQVAHAGVGRFATTRWSVVILAGGQSSRQADVALTTLCEAYWFPLYAFVRRQGRSVDDAQDLTQQFFAHVLEKKTLQVADPERGRFRSFLLTSMRNFLANEQRLQRAEKRGGGQAFISLDFDDGESRYQLEPSHEATPERIYERQWALTLLRRALASLRAHYESAGKIDHFNELKVFVGGDKANLPYRELADRLDMSEGSIKVAVHRLRRSYRELLRDEIKQTLGDQEDVDDELRQLFGTLST